MTLDELTQRLPTITAGLFAIGFVLLLLALVLFRRSRGANYWLHRRSAGRRGLRMLLLSMLFLTLSAGFCITTVLFSLIEDDDPVATGPGMTAMADFSSIVSPAGTIATLAETLELPTAVTVVAEESAVTTTTATVATPIETTTSSAMPSAMLDATATPTQTPTATVTATVTEADENAAAANTNALQTATGATMTLTATQSPTLTTSPTIENTSTATASVESSSTPTPTSTSSPAPTDTRVPSATLSPTPTATASDTSSPEPSATATPTQTPSATPTYTQTPTSTASPTETQTPSVTPTPSITPLPTISINNLAVTPLAEPGSEASLEIYAIDDALNADFEPVEATERFGPEIGRLYFFVRYEDMRSGALWRWELRRDDVVIDDRQRLWGASGTGRTFFFLRPAGGFVAGDYELRLFIGEADTPVNSVSFTVEP